MTAFQNIAVSRAISTAPHRHEGDSTSISFRMAVGEAVCSAVSAQWVNSSTDAPATRIDRQFGDVSAIPVLVAFDQQ
jgi:hypothetical protein